MLSKWSYVIRPVQISIEWFHKSDIGYGLTLGLTTPDLPDLLPCQLGRLSRWHGRQTMLVVGAEADLPTCSLQVVRAMPYLVTHLPSF